MPRFMICSCPLLFGSEDGALALKTSDDPVDGIEEILTVDLLLVLPGCSQGCFIAYIGNVCS